MTTPTRRVALEIPYASDVDASVTYARECVLHCLALGESPFASHLFFAQDGILDDDVPGELDLSILAGRAWLPVAASCVVYTDLGISPEMNRGILAAKALSIPVEFRRIR